MYKIILDADGDLPPWNVHFSRHYAWLWDRQKQKKYGGEQKAEPLYNPNFIQKAVDPLLRAWFFRGRPPILAGF